MNVMTARFSCKYKAGIYTLDGQDVKFEGGFFETNDPAIVEQLKKHHAMGEEIVLIRDLEEKPPKDTKEPPPEFPRHVGGGNYLLSNGEKVKGKQEALAAEAVLTK
jgi:hypothetical protein